MRIYSMTATFGKLDHQTLTLKPGLNIISAPNEWGKSTWCAFLTVMLYGFDTRLHTTKNALADKERYIPWSGKAMSGSIDLCWQGRDITIQRRTNGRIPMGDFAAFETHTGLAVPELTGANCGAMLLGVEKSVFQRAGFIRLADMPVTQDESLRRRLNALVTTGDDSDTAQILARQLKDLKNKCRANRSTGLLPQALAERDKLEASISRLREIEERCGELRDQQAMLTSQQEMLENHRQALLYERSRQAFAKLQSSREALEEARKRAAEREEACSQIPEPEELDTQERQLQELRIRQDVLMAQLSRIPMGTDREADPEQAEKDENRYRRFGALRTICGVLGLLLLLGGIAGCIFLELWMGVGILALGVLSMAVGLVFQRRCNRLLAVYDPVPPFRWAEDAATQQAEKERRNRLYQELDGIRDEVSKLTGDLPAAEYEQQLRGYREAWNAWIDARRECSRMEETVSTLTAACPEVQPPSLPDKMTSSLQQTEQWIAQCQRQQEQLQLQLGTCRGQMAAIGREEELQWQLDTLNRRIDKLEDTWAALSIAQETLTEATQQLQRRFAPKITQTAQALFQQMTIGRYEWLSMDEELRLQTAARTEDTLRSSMWRSDGTVDQLYLALRLAVARELTPEAPLVLDEALARFDDERLGAALEVLRQEAKTKQVILFTCQSREEAAQEKRLPPKPAPEKPAQEKAAPEKQNLFLRFLERLQ